MSANYLEATASGVTWQRCHNLQISNELGAAPVIRFSEEKVFNIDGTIVKKGMMGCAVLFDPTATISLVDPATNLPTGETVTHAQAYQILHSAYIQAAMARDAEEAA